MVPVNGEGIVIDQFILKKNINDLPRWTLMSVKVTEVHIETKKKKQKNFDLLKEKRWVTSASPPKSTVKEDADNR